MRDSVCCHEVKINGRTQLCDFRKTEFIHPGRGEVSLERSFKCLKVSYVFQVLLNLASMMGGSKVRLLIKS